MLTLTSIAVMSVEKKEYYLDLIINLLDLFGAYKSPEI